MSFALLLAATPALAQSVVAGTVSDPQNAVVVGAQVTLAAGANELRTVQTDAQGRYRFEAVPAGTYTVVVASPGFQIATSAAIVATAGAGATRNVTLALAGATDFVTVEGTAVAERGYRVPELSTLGALGAAPVLDTPYTVSVLPGELMVNGQVRNFKEASKYLPLVEFQEMQGSDILRPATRGMQGSNMQNARMDGMGIVVTGANSMESLQQIEVLNGVGGALYGPANPSGHVQPRAETADGAPAATADRRLRRTLDCHRAGRHRCKARPGWPVRLPHQRGCRRRRIVRQ